MHSAHCTLSAISTQYYACTMHINKPYALYVKKRTHTFTITRTYKSGSLPAADFTRISFPAGCGPQSTRVAATRVVRGVAVAGGGVAVAGRGGAGGGGECTLVLAPDWLTGFHHQLLLLCPWGRDKDATVEHRWDCNSYICIFLAIFGRTLLLASIIPRMGAVVKR